MDQDTFLTTLYVMIDDFCQSEGLHKKHRPGPPASLTCSEVVTLAVFGQWAQFPSERAFYRYALCHLRPAFPTLPDREQFNRLQRQYRDAIVAFSLCLVQQMQAQCCLYEALDSSGIPTRDAKRRGTGWLAGQADSAGRNFFRHTSTSLATPEQCRRSGARRLYCRQRLCWRSVASPLASYLQCAGGQPATSTQQSALVVQRLATLAGWAASDH